MMTYIMSSRERLITTLDLDEPDRVPVSPLLHVQFPSSFLGIDLSDLASPLASHPVWRAELETCRALKLDGMIDGAYDAVQATWPLPFLHTAASFLKLSGGVRIKISASREVGGRVWFRRDFETPKGILETECVVPRGDQAWEEKPLISNPSDDLQKLKCVLDGSISLDGYEKVRGAVGDLGIVKVMTHLPLNFWMGYRDTSGRKSIIDLYRQPDLVREYLRAYREMWLLPLVEACSEHMIDVMWLDGTYTGYINQKFFSDYVLPDLRELTKKASFPIMLFLSGGPCMRFIVDVGNSGIACIEGLDPPPTGDVSLSDVKARVGRSVCLKGNIETFTLETESPQGVEMIAKGCIDSAAYGGGYILSAVDQPTPRTPVANMVAMAKASIHYGKYR
jgi:hypothetical protein